jgi:hypothetical protein
MAQENWSLPNSILKYNISFLNYYRLNFIFIYLYHFYKILFLIYHYPIYQK